MRWARRLLSRPRSRALIDIAARAGNPRLQVEALFDMLAQNNCEEDSRGCALANAAVELTEPDHPARPVIEKYKADMRRRFRQLASAMGACVDRGLHRLGFARPCVAEQKRGYFSHLNLLRALGYAVAAVVAINVLKRLVPGVAHAPVNLHRTIGGFAHQAV